MEGDDADADDVPRSQRGSLDEDDVTEVGKQKGDGKVANLRVGPPKAKKARKDEREGAGQTGDMDAMHVDTDALDMEDDDDSEPVDLVEVRLHVCV